jgi:hypothetical protein
MRRRKAVEKTAAAPPWKTLRVSHFSHSYGYCYDMGLCCGIKNQAVVQSVLTVCLSSGGKFRTWFGIWPSGKRMHVRLEFGG